MAEQRIPTVPEALAALRLALHHALGCWPVRVHVFTAESAEPIPLAFPSGIAGGPGLRQDGSACPDEPFVPTPFQQAILDALDRKALRTDALGAAVGDRSRLFKPDGVKELRARGLVQHHSRLGYYRPDAPPEELENA